MSDLVGNPKDQFSCVTAHIICEAKTKALISLNFVFAFMSIQVSHDMAHIVHVFSVYMYRSFCFLIYCRDIIYSICIGFGIINFMISI